jgi:hypothetical protein
MTTPRRVTTTALGILLGLAVTAAPARAHCDTMNGPVVKAAQRALETRDVTPVLRWVRPQDETNIREAFKNTLSVRALGPQAQTLADRYFFETLVRIHRAGEGEPFTGLKPADAPIDPAVAAADEALAGGSADALVRMVTAKVAEGIRHRFDRAAALRTKADASVEAGREFVEAYVLFTHYVEGVHQAAEAPAGHGTPAHTDAVAAGHAHVK